MNSKLFKVLLLLSILIVFVPASVFAATSNSISKVPTVVAGTEFQESDAPVLRIEEENAGEFNGMPQEFQLKLQNAVWPEDAAQRLEDSAQQSESAELMFERLSETTMRVSLSGAGTGSEPYYVKIPLVSVVEASGLVKCTVSELDSNVSGGIYTYAMVPTQEKTVRISMEELVDVDGGTRNFTLGDMVIEESAAGALINPGRKPVKITLQLSDGLAFASAKCDSEVFGGLSGAATKSKLKSRTQMEVTLNASQRDAARRGGMVLSGIELKSKKLKSSTEIFVNVAIESGGYNGKQSVLAGAYTVADLRLKTLGVGHKTEITPAFDPDTYRYSVDVPKTWKSITFDFETMEPGMPVVWHGVGIYQDENVTVPLKIGKNTFKVTVGDPENRKVSKTYTIDVFRARR